MRDHGAFSWTIALAVFAAILAIAVMLGASIFGIDPLNILAVAVLALAAAVVVPG